MMALGARRCSVMCLCKVSVRCSGVMGVAFMSGSTLLELPPTSGHPYTGFAVGGFRFCTSTFRVSDGNGCCSVVRGAEAVEMTPGD